MAKKILLKRHTHPQSREIVLDHWMWSRSEAQAKFFLKFTCGLFLGASLALWLQYWR